MRCVHRNSARFRTSLQRSGNVFLYIDPQAWKYMTLFSKMASCTIL